MATEPKVITYQEWLKMPAAEDAIEEVVNGEVRLMPPNKWASHAVVIENLRDALGAQLDRRTVRIASSNFGLVIRQDPLTCRVPDLAVFRKQNMVVKDGYVHSPPELVVEVLSPANTRRERAGKLRDYESIGVPEIWVASPEARTIEVLRLEGGKLQTMQVVREGELRPREFPEAAIRVPSIWDE